MRSEAFWRVVTVDESGFLDRLLRELEALGGRFCVVGGQAVNAYVEPLVSLDLDLVLAAEDVERLVVALGYGVQVERFAHTVNLRADGSDLRVQLQVDPRYAEFPSRAAVREILGRRLPVARLEDVVAGKVWAASDPSRRPSKRQKDLADLARLLEAYPNLRPQVPAALLEKLL